MVQNEFKDLCFLLTAKSINEAGTMSDWDGIQSGREKLVDQLQTMVDIEAIMDQSGDRPYVPPFRLQEILNQAAAFQISNSPYHVKSVPEISTQVQEICISILCINHRLFHLACSRIILVL